jgi:hypothetical protein
LTVKRRFRGSLAALLLAACCLLPLSLRADAPAVAVLPFDNLSSADVAPHELAALVEKAIAMKGWRVAPSAGLEPLLEKARVRYLDSLDPAIRAQIVEATGVSAIVTGSVYSYSSGRNPIVALSARMVRADGTIAWGEVAGMSADDTEKPLGFGKQETTAGVAESAVRALMRHFPEAGDESVQTQGKRKPLFHAGPISFRASDLDPATPHRVCLLPLDNISGMPDSGRIVFDVLSLRLAAAAGFEVVEPAALRAAALKAGIASFRSVTSDDLLRLAPAVGTPLFLRGTIYTYRDPTGNAASAPEIQLEISLVDVQAGRVLWTAQHGRRGSDYVGFLMRGAVSNTVALTDRVVGEMIATATRPAGRGATALTADGTPAHKKPAEKHSRLRGAAVNGEHQ